MTNPDEQGLTWWQLCAVLITITICVVAVVAAFKLL